MNLTRRQYLAQLTGSLFAPPAILRGGSRRPGEKPNLLFLWTDEQRADTMAAYGNRTYRVPVLNRLASQSVVFLRCYDTQPVCTPARSTVMTGLWPHQTGCLQNNIPLKPETKTLVELLDDPDYYTGYFGKWHLGDEVFPQHGFHEWISIEDTYTEYYSPARDRNARSSYHQFLVELGYTPNTKDRKFSRDFAVRLPVEHCKPAFLAREATRFILQNRHRPWILYVNFLEPHMPFFGPYNDLHSSEEAPVPANYPGIPIRNEPQRYHRIRAEQQQRPYQGLDLTQRASWERLNRNYAGLCTQVDQALGRILWALEASGQADNTIIVFTSDHGEMMGSHSLYGKQVAYEEAVRVPLLLYVPFRKHKAFSVSQPVSHISLVPTLLELLGKRVPELLPGKSLLPLLEGREQMPEPVFIEWHSGESGPTGRYVVSPEGWKLVLYDRDHGMLFDQRRDPLELHNLYGEPAYRQITRQLYEQLLQWQARVQDPARMPEPA